ncbi:MAG TPA: hypothetical protein VKX39_05285 [Bryobacteraceae bacterium]|nr:hypothetical protein [Bryobacteraceae bacterium]
MQITMTRDNAVQSAGPVRPGDEPWPAAKVTVGVLIYEAKRCIEPRNPKLAGKAWRKKRGWRGERRYGYMLLEPPGGGEVLESKARRRDSGDDE